MAAAKSPGRTLRRILSRLLGALMLVSLVGGIGGLCYLDHHTSAAWDEATLAVFEPVSAGEFERAYAALSRERRAAMSREAFTALVDHPAYRGVPDATYPDARQDDPNCRDAVVELEDGAWTVQIYLVQEDGQWRVHAFALQQPTATPLGTLLPECRFNAGTMAGYAGPAPERATRPTH